MLPDAAADYTLPYLHPVIVHFPPVLLLFAALAATVWAVTARPAWRWALLGFLATGAVASWLAEETGETLYDSMYGAPEVEALIGLHSQGATWTLWLSVATTLLLIAATVWLRRRGTAGTAVRDPLWLRLVFTLLAWAAAAAVAWTGHLGGLMVWGVPG